MWVKKHEPEIYAKCAHILLPKDYIRLTLTGEYATEVSDASGMQLLDVPARKWSDEVLEKLGIDKKLLGKVYESTEITGYLTKEAAEKCALAEGTPVVGGAGDNAAAAVGEGVVSDGRAFTTIGTCRTSTYILLCRSRSLARHGRNSGSRTFAQMDKRHRLHRRNTRG